MSEKAVDICMRHPEKAIVILNSPIVLSSQPTYFLHSFRTFFFLITWLEFPVH